MKLFLIRCLFFTGAFALVKAQTNQRNVARANRPLQRSADQAGRGPSRKSGERRHERDQGAHRRFGKVDQGATDELSPPSLSRQCLHPRQSRCLARPRQADLSPQWRETDGRRRRRRARQSGGPLCPRHRLFRASLVFRKGRRPPATTFKSCSSRSTAKSNRPTRSIPKRSRRSIITQGSVSNSSRNCPRRKTPGNGGSSSIPIPRWPQKSKPSRRRKIRACDQDSASHFEHNSKPRLVAQHARVGFVDLGQRENFHLGAHAGENAEVQRVLGIL